MAVPAADVPPVLTPEEAADLLRAHPETVRTWLRNGHIDGCKVGRMWKIPRSAVLDDDGRVRPIGPSYSE